jgi:hypothetical protein
VAVVVELTHPLPELEALAVVVLVVALVAAALMRQLTLEAAVVVDLPQAAMAVPVS